MKWSDALICLLDSGDSMEFHGSLLLVFDHFNLVALTLFHLLELCDQLIKHSFPFPCFYLLPFLEYLTLKFFWHLRTLSLVLFRLWHLKFKIYLYL